MTSKHIAFAVPGDLATLTGGYIYDRRLMAELSAAGWVVDHIQLPHGFPNPTDKDTQDALEMLAKIPASRPVVIDGLAFGALDPVGVAKLSCPIIALTHHPLAKEGQLPPERRDHLFETERANLAMAACVIVTSPHTKDILVAEYGLSADAITVARPGIDQPSLPSSPDTPPVIVSVGNLTPRKGHDVLLHALSLIKDLDWTAKIVGTPLDKDHASQLAQLRDDLGLSRRVEFTGKVHQATLGSLYQRASIFALATQYEGYGIVFDEALVHGLPIVSCATGAVVDTVPDDAGFLVPVGQPEPFAQALARLLSDDAARQNCATASLNAGRLRPSWAATAASVERALIKTLGQVQT